MDFPHNYIAAWSLVLTVGLTLAILRRRELELFQRDYWRCVAHPWKLGAFVLATAPLILLAPYCGDPTWDAPDAAFMAALMFTTGPWVVATFYRAIRGRQSWVAVYIAVCLWLFSASWSYDLYIYLRDGEYPPTWAVNIAASSVLYFGGSLFFSLAYTSQRGIHFGFTEADWPQPRSTMSYRKLVLWALPFAVLYALMFGAVLVSLS